MLQVSGLTVRYGATLAVDAVDLSVGEGEIVALVGPNGAGKTSLLRAISQVVPSTGDVRFDGRTVSGSAPDAVARLGLVQVPEGRHVFPNLTVRENLLVGMSARQGRPAEFGLDEVHDLFPKLAELSKRGGWALSGGEQQMVAVARALLAAPRLLLLDEPSLGLAPSICDVVFDALAEVGRRVPLLLVEQNTDRALALADRAYVLVHGKVVTEAPASDLADRESLMASYLGH